MTANAPQVSDAGPLGKLFDSLAGGDLAAALDCLAADGQVWHCFDRIAHDRAGSAQEWANFIAAFPERSFSDVRTSRTANGYVRQHVMTVRTSEGKRLSWEVCVVAVTEGDRIRRLDEYLDRGGSFSPAADHCTS